VWLGSMALLLLLLSSLQPGNKSLNAPDACPDPSKRIICASQQAELQDNKQLVTAEATVDAVSCNNPVSDLFTLRIQFQQC
jgi:hypothetical protein